MIATTQERRVLSTRYRVREFSTAGEISEAFSHAHERLSTPFVRREP